MLLIFAVAACWRDGRRSSYAQTCRGEVSIGVLTGEFQRFDAKEVTLVLSVVLVRPFSDPTAVLRIAWTCGRLGSDRNVLHRQHISRLLAACRRSELWLRTSALEQRLVGLLGCIAQNEKRNKNENAKPLQCKHNQTTRAAAVDAPQSLLFLRCHHSRSASESRREKRIPLGATSGHSIWIFRTYPDSPGSRALSHLLIRRYCIFLAEGQVWNVALPQ
ncbi:hypothetical protein CO676_18970 [Sinorhizobium sp. BJ1]|nr:hypothetical protein CO676_18970 [Sinorhizobium sp. BJ1]